MLKTKKFNVGNLPNLVVIGAAKCGTTSLHYYLDLHSEISMSREKELDYFIKTSNWLRGIEWYKSNFKGKGKIFGESSVGYTHPFFRGVAKRMHSIIPETKIIYALRDPVDRIVSDYIHNYSDGHEVRDLKSALADFDNNLYVSRSKYFKRLESFTHYFAKSNILIITLEELSDNPKQTMQRIFRFLNVDETFYSPNFLRIRQKSSEKRRKNKAGQFLKKVSEKDIAKAFSPEFRRNIGRVLYLPFSKKIQRLNLDAYLRERLIAHLKQDVDRMREYAGRDFSSWRV